MKISILLSFLSIVHFCLPKNEPKRAADHLVPRCGTPQRCSQKNGRHRKVAALRRVAYPFFAPLLGCVKRQKQKKLILKFFRKFQILNDAD
jgi:hypothetical protein